MKGLQFKKGPVIFPLALLAVVLGALGKVVCAVVQSHPLSSNPLIQLEATAILFFLALMYYRKRHGG